MNLKQCIILAGIFYLITFFGYVVGNVHAQDNVIHKEPDEVLRQDVGEGTWRGYSYYTLTWKKVNVGNTPTISYWLRVHVCLLALFIVFNADKIAGRKET